MADKLPLIFYDDTGKKEEIRVGDKLPISRLASGIPDGTKFIRDDGTLVTVSANAPDIALSLLSPSVDETITAGYSAVLVRSYAVASGKKLTIDLNGRFRIL